MRALTKSGQSILLVIAFVCFLVAAIGVPSRVNLLALGLALWLLSTALPLFASL